jgi:hypothetical protein
MSVNTFLNFSGRCILSLRKAINAKCKQCIYDPMDVGIAAQQIAAWIDVKLNRATPEEIEKLVWGLAHPRRSG